VSVIYLLFDSVFEGMVSLRRYMVAAYLARMKTGSCFAAAG
jgi:hypothetical protein